MDWERIAADTPSAEGQVFLDSAGSSLPPTPVLDTVIGHLRREAEIGGYRAANECAADLDRIKVSLGALLGAPSSSIALADSASRAWTQVFYAVPLQPGDRILLSGVEYASNAVAALQRGRDSGAVVEVVPSDPTGQIDLDALAGLLDERVRILSLVHVPTNGGLVNPVREVVELAHAHGTFVLLDACQSVGQLRVDATELGVDALSGTGRKWLRGPRGTGFLYVRPDLISSLEPPVIDLHSATWSSDDSYVLREDATRFELWERDVAAHLGLGAAVDYLLNLGIDEVQKAIADRARQLREALGGIPQVHLRDLGRQQCGIVSFSVDGIEPVAVRDTLADQDITVTVSRNTSTLFDMRSRGLSAVVRASPHYFVRPDQLDSAITAIAVIAAPHSTTSS